MLINVFNFQVATGMVACTFLSAPLMFVSAKMMTVVVDNEMDYKKLLLTTDFDFSVISLVCNVSTFSIHTLTKPVPSNNSGLSC